MTKFKMLTGLAAAFAISAGMLGGVSGAQAENIRKSEPAPYGYARTPNGPVIRGESRSNRTERRIRRNELQIQRSERQLNRAERRSRRSEGRRYRVDPNITTTTPGIAKAKWHRNSKRHQFHYQRKHHGKRYRHRRSGFANYYNGFWYSVPFWTSGYDNYYESSASDWDLHVDWCHDRYRSYNERRDAYKGYDGRWHRCNSPYN